MKGGILHLNTQQRLRINHQHLFHFSCWFTFGCPGCLQHLVLQHHVANCICSLSFVVPYSASEHGVRPHSPLPAFPTTPRRAYTTAATTTTHTDYRYYPPYAPIATRLPHYTRLDLTPTHYACPPLPPPFDTPGCLPLLGRPHHALRGPHTHSLPLARPPSCAHALPHQRRRPSHRRPLRHPLPTPWFTGRLYITCVGRWFFTRLAT